MANLSKVLLVPLFVLLLVRTFTLSGEAKEGSNDLNETKDDTTSTTTDSDSSTINEAINDNTNNPLLKFNSSQYTWAGNHFIPPEGMPTFSPSNFASYFKGRNTLFIGDSTGRRAYATLFGMINSTDQSDVQVSEIDHRLVIDFNKQGGRQERCLIPGRTLMNDNNTALLNKDVMVCRNIFVSDPANSTQSNTPIINNFQNDNTTTANINNLTGENSVINSSESNNDSSSSNLGKFDFAKLDCLVSLSPFVLNQTKANMTGAESLKDYDLVIVSIGIHDAINRCGAMRNEAGEKLSNEDKFDLFLDGLVNLSSPNLQIAFRTPGYHANADNNVMNMLKDHAINHIAKQQSITEAPGGAQAVTGDNGATKNTSNFTVVDWGSVISKRSFGERRIQGDLKTHYGLEARQLFAQQLLHELLASTSN